MTSIPHKIAPHRLAMIEADQIDALFENLSIGLLAALAAAVVLYGFITLHGHVAATVMNIWLAVMLVQTGARLVLVRAYQRVKPPPEQRQAWHAVFIFGAFVAGTAWGIGSLLMVTPGEFDIQLFIIIIISAIVYGSLSGFGSYLPFYALLFPSLLPLTLWSAFQHDLEHITFAIMGLIWIPVVAWLGYLHDGSVKRSLNLRYENLELLEDLKIQKDKAEQANFAKSQFLASASHDLRQPVHALGLFVGALRAHEMSVEARKLLDHVAASVGALDGLFTALLDISRLDAGVIAANRRAFMLDPILRRIVSDLRPEAEAKGLSLKLVPCSVAVESDPLLSERILRNIVANAVRYTSQGRVLVGCRRGGGLRVQVWDTGPGISRAHQEKIFEEFFQIANPGRDRAQGLGLGLAIVRRLTGLLNHPLRFTSVPGRGSLFEVSMPVSQFVDAHPASERIIAASPNAVAGLVLVVDDEAAICEAMSRLLESWGHDVITALSGDDMLARVATCARPPALIICDYRLQDGENGIDVIRRLQSEFNEDIPAMLITGDTAPDRLQSARDSGFLLLHKPLSADRLREAMRTMMQARAAG
jgi:signal transduction histidine kinase/CheY-like chemotaxis protein